MSVHVRSVASERECIEWENLTCWVDFASMGAFVARNNAATLLHFTWTFFCRLTLFHESFTWSQHSTVDSRCAFFFCCCCSILHSQVHITSTVLFNLFRKFFLLLPFFWRFFGSFSCFSVYRVCNIDTYCYFVAIEIFFSLLLLCKLIWQIEVFYGIFMEGLKKLNGLKKWMSVTYLNEIFFSNWIWRVLFELWRILRLNLCLFKIILFALSQIFILSSVEWKCLFLSTYCTHMNYYFFNQILSLSLPL